ncbi:ABC transporter substrate-binding protein [Paraburkholderia sp.]|uniref:ABC transporter substrate-binding protein n=1 Tax=Paraburkholderia sp. TaxID=1926495 RepID=UPI003D7006DE
MRVKFAYAESIAAAVALLTAYGKKSDGEAGNGASVAVAAAVSAGSVTAVKIGHTAPLTRGIAHLGKDNENGARLAVEEINAQGLTVDGRRIERQFDGQHDAADPKACTQAARALVDDHADAVTCLAKIVERKTTNDLATDIRATLTKVTKISSVQPDVIMSSGMNATGAPFMKQAAPGSRAKILGGDGVCTGKVGEQAEIAVQNLVRSKAGLALSTMDKGAGFEKKSGDHIHTPAQIDAPFAYDALYAIVDAMKRAGSIDAPRVLAATPSTGYNEVIGDIAFDDKGDLKDHAITLYDFRDGKKAVLDVVKM